VESAERHGLKYVVPCHGAVHCLVTGLSFRECASASASVPCAGGISLEGVSVLAGHFSWNVWRSLPSFQRSVSSPAPPCLVMWRHPVSRVISYYYERCFNGSSCPGYQRRLNDMGADEMTNLLDYFRQAKYAEDNRTLVITDEGMSDAACRAMSDTKGTTGRVVGQDPIPIPALLTASERQEALDNAEKCVVGLTEQWDLTVSVLRHFFPWLDLSRSYRLMKLYDNMETLSTLRPDIRAVIEAANACDMTLHEVMMSRFERALELVLDVQSLER
jgi:hypothetical protein